MLISANLVSSSAIERPFFITYFPKGLLTSIKVFASSLSSSINNFIKAYNKGLSYIT